MKYLLTLSVVVYSLINLLKKIFFKKKEKEKCLESKKSQGHGKDQW